MITAFEPGGTGTGVVQITDDEFHRFRDLILKLAGIHLNDNKRHLVVARLGGRIRELDLDTFSEYYDYAIRDASGNELRTLINQITTNKTSFFREPHHFDLLRSRVIPEARKRGERELRIWSAACSSGEEPYSIAMTVREALRGVGSLAVRILASDIDTQMLANAQAGRYAMESLEGISEARRRAHFLKGYGRYEGMAQVQPHLRTMIDFRQIKLHDSDWGLPAHFDVIFCRNVLIYFDRALQEEVVRRLAGHLKPDGYLFLGHSETIQGQWHGLAPVGPTAYQARTGRASIGGNDQCPQRTVVASW